MESGLIDKYDKLGMNPYLSSIAGIIGGDYKTQLHMYCRPGCVHTLL